MPGTCRAGAPALARYLGAVLLLAGPGCSGDARGATEVAASPSGASHPARVTAPASTPTAPNRNGEAAPRPRTLTPADDGALVHLRVGQSVELVVRGPGGQVPRVEGEAVVLVEVLAVTARGHREWEVRAVRPGVAHVRAGAGQPWTLTFRVAG